MYNFRVPSGTGSGRNSTSDIGTGKELLDDYMAKVSLDDCIAKVHLHDKGEFRQFHDRDDI